MAQAVMDLTGSALVCYQDVVHSIECLYNCLEQQEECLQVADRLMSHRTHQDDPVFKQCVQLIEEYTNLRTLYSNSMSISSLFSRATVNDKLTKLVLTVRSQVDSNSCTHITSSHDISDDKHMNKEKNIVFSSSETLKADTVPCMISCEDVPNSIDVCNSIITAKKKSVKTSITKSISRNKRKIKKKETNKKKKKKQSKSSDRLWPCDYPDCFFVAKYEAALKLHKVSHSEERPYACEECDKTFKTIYTLREHQERHKGGKFTCNFEGCEAVYSDTATLRKHIRWQHLGEDATHRCEWPGCNYSTHRSDVFKRHQTVHTNERAFPCYWPDCGKSFKTPNNLREHLRTHKNERLYKCQWSGCDYSCNCSGNLRKHVFIHERKQQQQQQKMQSSHAMSIQVAKHENGQPQ